MQFLQFDEDWQDEAMLHNKLSEIHLQLKPCRFIADLNQKLPVCYPNIDDQAISNKITQQPQMRSLPHNPLPPTLPLSKAASSNQNQNKFSLPQIPDPQKHQPRCKPNMRKRLTIQKKLSENAPLNGSGVIKLKDGKVVFGNWKNGEAVGVIKIMYPSGNIYIGEAKNYIRNGKGLFCYKNGYKYDGDFVNGKFEGYGVMTNEYGEVVGKGVWGKGTLVQSIV